MSYDKVLQELRIFGFRVNEKFFIDTFGDSDSCSYNEAYNELLHSDFRKSAYLEPTFGPTINTIESDTLEGPIVLQITSVANISQPSKRQHEDCTPRVLLIKLNDGHTSANAIEYERVPEISCKIAPGTKILIKNSVKIFCGKIFLNAKSCRILGGRVEHLYNAWLTNRTTLSNRKLKKQEQHNEGDVPPSFEMSIARRNPLSNPPTAYKANDASDKSKVKSSYTPSNKKSDPSRDKKPPRPPSQNMKESSKSVKFNKDNSSKDSGREGNIPPPPHASTVPKQNKATNPSRKSNSQSGKASKPSANTSSDSGGKSTAFAQKQQPDIHTKKPHQQPKRQSGKNERDEKRKAQSNQESSKSRGGKKGGAKVRDRANDNAPTTGMSNLSLFLPSNLPPPPPPAGKQEAAAGSKKSTGQGQKKGGNSTKKYTFSS